MNSQKFCKKSSEIISCFWVKKLVFETKKTILGSKVWKPLFWGWKQLFPKIPNFQKFWNLFYSKYYEKMTFNLNFENCEKLVPTWKPTRMFGLKFGMQGLTLRCWKKREWFINYVWSDTSLDWSKKVTRHEWTTNKEENRRSLL